MLGRVAAIAWKKDVAPVYCCKWSSGLAAAVYVLALPTAGIPALAGQSEMKPAQSRETKPSSVNSQTAPPKAVVVITGTLDLGKITIADFGDVEPANR